MDEKHYGLQQAQYTEKPVNAFDNLGEAVSSLREIQKMAQALADRLTGSQPANAADQKLQAVGSGGLIDGVARQASAIREIHADIYASLSRIENRL
ncbi:hypothetical protein EN866_34405 [Mesorhizobium sp. M2D.F.Ca.ET.223.01.1.1]|uniref:hypothetical protein n=1 Tax=Mesorhizobium sp. M2D.F.Ca.ET.223.01.1.1 TaxID=2563940 RepID=UPI001093175F|nr:hypothetical protein [Mesorhizobium sp. M2D.F.Ca.ET.223.01.1.1]TGR83024.1 hypothetical protein EN866_34405 [Mesorhizobium sp. M2D.F.Ca.ET.223.01.1.1]TGT64478.1 hypothetical protein EN802_32335 [bacterium M00.F.Ca.ET.159.01.1.1]TGT79323.1 hypothetical protein EN800_31675 [bacterium M00.F.Ca.ET.157.01.1.1]